MNPDEFINWLYIVERLLEFKKVPADRVVKYMAIKLKRNDFLWWENLKRNRNREGRSKITTWDKMKKFLQRKHIPDQYQQDLFLQFTQLQQQLLVEEYVAAFEQYSLKCGLIEPEENTSARFLGGLQPAISNVVQLQLYWTFQDEVILALKVEKQQHRFKKSVEKSSMQDSVTKKLTLCPSKPPSLNSRTQEDSIPRRGMQNGPSQLIFPARKCFKCQGYEHIAVHCLNHRTV
ncbi:hypothetical protein MA16_Dca019348 [Dendrobium catenatum]|uniref:Retrotransposon gag domain-containing protein n=1 Tax=Dendrobium catenatum TaxID=906689 RepID=A0A2I0WRY4_9ASPA|nr:hypothetical protein MA16_Dca019348 [Dendrobium catenatum]